MKFTQFIVISLIALTAISCARPSKSSSTVVIQIPEGSNSEKVSALGDSNTNFVSPVIDPGKLENINCYMVAVHAADDPVMKRNSCGRYDRFTYNNVINIGPWQGGAIKGGKLEIEVPSGVGRTFYLVGAYTTTEAACTNLSNTFNPNTTSRFYIIGKAENVKLEGEAVDVTINTAYDPDSYFEDCSGDDFLKVTKIAKAPSAIVVTKSTFPEQSFLKNYCEQIEISMVDDYLRPSPLPRPVNIQIESKPTTSGAFNLTSTFATSRACAEGTSDTTFEIKDGVSTKTRWIKATTPGSYRFRAVTLESTTLVSKISDISTISPPVGMTVYQVMGPTDVKKDTCYKYFVYQKDLGTKQYVTPYNTDKFFIHANSPNISLFLTPSCNAGDAIVGDPEIGFAGSDFAVFYAKFGTYVGTNLHTLTFAVSTSENSDPQTKEYIYKIGTINPAIGTFYLQGLSKNLKNTNICNGPYFFSFVNSDGTGALTKSNAEFEIKPSESSISAYDTCSSPTQLTKFTVPAGTQLVRFYLRAASTFTGNFTIRTKLVDGRITVEKEFANEFWNFEN